MRSYRIHEVERTSWAAITAWVGLALLGWAVGFFFVGTWLTDTPKATRPASIQPMSVNEIIGCTAFSVNDRQHLWATAHHCVFLEGELRTPRAKMAGLPFLVVREDEANDLVLIHSLGSAPSLKPAHYEPIVGDEVSTRGHAMRSPQVLSFFGRLSHPAYVFRDEEVPVSAAFDMVAMSGVSGSPILNAHGRVVSLVQGVYQPQPVGNVVWGARYSVLRAFIGEDWE